MKPFLLGFMAGDWIKMRGNLWDDPRIAKLCHLTGQTEAAIVGALYWLWATADQHTENGIMPGLMLQQIDRKTGVQGFGQALCDIRWLADHPEGVRILNFEEHNGASAKRRSADAQRKANVRSLSASDADKTRTSSGKMADNFGQVAELEKRREEKSNSVPIGTGDKPPTDRDIVFANGVPLLTVAGVAEKNARSMLAGLCKSHGEGAVASVLADCARCRPIEPVAWIQAALKGIPGGGGKQSALEARNRAVADEWAKGESHATQ